MRRSRVVAAIACCACITPVILAWRGEFASYTSGTVLGLIFIGFCALASGALVWFVTRRKELQDLEEKASTLSRIAATELTSAEEMDAGLAQSAMVPAGSGIPSEVLQRAAQNAPKVLFEARRRKGKAKSPSKSSETIS